MPKAPGRKNFVQNDELTNGQLCDILYIEIKEGSNKMRIVKVEQIYLSQNEADTWTKFDEILLGIERGSENPDTTKLINRIQCLLADLWEVIEEVD